MVEIKHWGTNLWPIGETEEKVSSLLQSPLPFTDHPETSQLTRPTGGWSCDIELACYLGLGKGQLHTIPFSFSPFLLRSPFPSFWLLWHWTPQHCLFLIKTFNFVLGYSWLTSEVVIVSGEPWRHAAIHMHLSTLPLTPLPSWLSHNIEQSSICYIVGPCWLSILHTAVCTCSLDI